MERLAIIAHLKEGSEHRAAELVEAGPPFDLAVTGIVRHSVYVSAHEVVFVFEGHEIEWIVDQLIDEPFHYELHRALEQWQEIVDGRPRVARERFGWQLDEEKSLPSQGVKGASYERNRRRGRPLEGSQGGASVRA